MSGESAVDVQRFASASLTASSLSDRRPIRCVACGREFGTSGA